MMIGVHVGDGNAFNARKNGKKVVAKEARHLTESSLAAIKKHADALWVL